ncbi:hypothetical protein E4U43_003515 [Claviceps pusilla]|uniref:Uncharacterized protein n=1 Tax=Claviceps pusilla TaxID=123648 RepID=A0A9P7N4L4_9HYPO|nr:hypothetical protein E4U43_003515 [Claviceps pusilla]
MHRDPCGGMADAPLRRDPIPALTAPNRVPSPRLDVYLVGIAAACQLQSVTNVQRAQVPFRAPVTQPRFLDGRVCVRADVRAVAFFFFSFFTHLPASAVGDAEVGAGKVEHGPSSGPWYPACIEDWEGRHGLHSGCNVFLADVFDNIWGAECSPGFFHRRMQCQQTY